MSNESSRGCPALLARVERGAHLESSHFGSVVAVSEEGEILAMAGDPARLTYLRSSAKPFQLNPFVAIGGDERFGLTGADLALAAASHSGEPVHTSRALAMLEKGGFAEADLHCGAHPPMYEAAAHDLIREGKKPAPLHNNCSGKHAAMLLACRMLGFSPDTYYEPGHPYQQRVISAVSRATGTPDSLLALAVDGCSVPVFRMPLVNLALGYCRLLGNGFGAEAPEERKAREKIAKAMMDYPEMVGGTGRFTTRIMEVFRGKLIAKEGADGVYALSVSSALASHISGGQAVGIALKIEDGGERCRDLIVMDVLETLGLVPPELKAPARALASREVRNVRGDLVGQMRSAFVLEGGNGKPLPPR